MARGYPKGAPRCKAQVTVIKVDSEGVETQKDRNCNRKSLPNDPNGYCVECAKLVGEAEPKP